MSKKRKWQRVRLEDLADKKTQEAILVMIERLFEASIPVKTLQSRAFREKNKMTSNEVNQITPKNSSEIPEKQEYQEVTPKSALAGPGRSPKYQKEPEPYTRWCNSLRRPRLNDRGGPLTSSFTRADQPGMAGESRQGGGNQGKTARYLGQGEKKLSPLPFIHGEIY